MLPYLSLISGRIILSIVLIRIPIIIRAIPFVISPVVKRKKDAGIQITGVPIIGIKERMSARNPQKRAFGIPSR